MARLQEYEENARQVFDRARRDNTIQAYAEAIGSYPESEAVQDRLAVLTDLVETTFPPWYETSQIDVHDLANAVTNGHPYLVAAMPSYAAGRAPDLLSPKEWRATTLFLEIAGKPATIEEIDSNVWGSPGATFHRTSGLPENGITVPAGGRAEHMWFCRLDGESMYLGFDLSRAELRYKYADDRWVPRTRHAITFHDPPFLLDRGDMRPHGIYDDQMGRLCRSKLILDIRQRGSPPNSSPWEFCAVDAEGYVSTWRNTGTGKKRISVDVTRRALSEEDLTELKANFTGLATMRSGPHAGASHCLDIWFGDGDALGHRRVGTSSPGSAVARIRDILSTAGVTTTMDTAAPIPSTRSGSELSVEEARQSANQVATAHLERLQKRHRASSRNAPALRIGDCEVETDLDQARHICRFFYNHRDGSVRRFSVQVNLRSGAPTLFVEVSTEGKFRVVTE